jgi:hypothetical protein
MRLTKERQDHGPDPQRGNYNSFASFGDPEGNSWLLQEVARTRSGRDAAE